MRKNKFFLLSHQLGKNGDGLLVVKDVGGVGVILSARDLFGHGGDLLVGVGKVHVGQGGDDGGDHVGGGAEGIGKGREAGSPHLGGHVSLHKGTDKGTAGAAVGNAVPQGNAVAEGMGEAGARHLDGEAAAGGINGGTEAPAPYLILGHYSVTGRGL